MTVDPHIFSVKREGCDCGVSSELIQLMGELGRGGIGNLLGIVSHCAIAWQGASVSYLELYHIVQFVSL